MDYVPDHIRCDVVRPAVPVLAHLAGGKCLVCGIEGVVFPASVVVADTADPSERGCIAVLCSGCAGWSGLSGYLAKFAEDVVMNLKIGRRLAMLRAAVGVRVAE
jgi:hypothetical protein